MVIPLASPLAMSVLSRVLGIGEWRILQAFTALTWAGMGAVAGNMGVECWKVEEKYKMVKLENLGADPGTDTKPPAKSDRMVVYAQIPYKCIECGMNLWPSENESLLHLSFAHNNNPPCRWSGRRFHRPTFTLEEAEL